MGASPLRVSSDRVARKLMRENGTSRRKDADTRRRESWPSGGSDYIRYLRSLFRRQANKFESGTNP